MPQHLIAVRPQSVAGTMGASTPAPSRVAIPHVAAPGTISAELVLSKEDVRLAIDKLKWAEEELQWRR